MSKIESPCIRNCCLDDNDICMGCFRTLDEVKAWLSLAENQKREVLNQCHTRKENNIRK